MKICILGLDGAAPRLMFSDERLVNIRRLMELGVYGDLKAVVPPGSVPGWTCLAASQDPGSLGLYGLRQRDERTYSPPAITAPPAIQGPALWDVVAAAGRKSIIFGVPPNFPPRPVPGISVGCFLTPDTAAAADFTSPPGLSGEIRKLIGDFSADVKLVAGQNKHLLREQIFTMSRKQWEVLRWLLREQEWDYFHFVDIGLNRVQRGFWENFDPQHPRYPENSPDQSIIPDYYLWLDEQVGSVLELLDPETVLLLVSVNGMQRMDGGFAINQWLLEQGLLALSQPPAPGITEFDRLTVDWSRTRAWSGDGPFASIYFNLAGREPNGVVAAAEYEEFRNQLTAQLGSLRDHGGRPLLVQVFQPNEIYRSTNHCAPDLIVQLGEGRWSSIGSIGHAGFCVQNTVEGCNPSGAGLFVLTSPNCPLAGEYAGAGVLELAPTLLDLAGYEIPGSMQGRSLVTGMEKKRDGSSPDSDQIIMDRLAGLGYV